MSDTDAAAAAVPAETTESQAAVAAEETKTTEATPQTETTATTEPEKPATETAAETATTAATETATTAATTAATTTAPAEEASAKNESGDSAQDASKASPTDLLCDLTKNTTGKHPLESAWVIWFDSRKTHNASTDWFGNLQTVAIFKTVEDFWRTHTHVKRPTELEFGSNYHFFKQGIKPMWEDELNKAGGKWVFALDQEKLRVDDVWELLLLAMIGESLEPAEDNNIICGAVISKRKVGTRISVWTKISHDTPENEKLLLALGNELRTALKLNEKTELDFQDHADSISSNTSYRNQARLKLGGSNAKK